MLTGNAILYIYLVITRAYINKVILIVSIRQRIEMLFALWIVGLIIAPDLCSVHVIAAPVPQENSKDVDGQCGK